MSAQGEGEVSEGCLEVLRLMNGGDFAKSYSLAMTYANQKDGDCAVMVGLHHYYGYSAKMSDEIRDEWLKKGVELGSGLAKAFQMYHKRDGASGVLLIPFAERGVSVAQSALGRCYEHGWGVGEDNAKAMEWFVAAAEQGLAAAKHNVGVFWSEGKGVPKDPEKATVYYKEAADLGHVQSQYNMSLFYEKGEGVPKDTAESLKYLTRATDQSFPPALYNMAYHYEVGEMLPKNQTEANKYFQLAADEGDLESRYLLGARYIEGNGFPKDREKGIVFLLQAHAKGYANATHYLWYLFAEAMERRSLDDVDDLIQRWGIPVDITDEHGRTPLHICAFYYPNVQIAQKLIEFGADVNVKQREDGDTPLHLAAERGHCDLITVLLDAGADRDITNLDGNTPSEVARSDDIAELIDEYIEPPLTKGADIPE